MASISYPVNFVEKNDYMCWHVCSQCYNLGTVVLRDDSTQYFTAEKTSTSTDLQHIAKGGDFYKGGSNLRFEINIPASKNITASVSRDGITDGKGANVGALNTFCVEDSTDQDYNDLYINIAAWHKKG
jgi:hypothetical protein